MQDAEQGWQESEAAFFSRSSGVLASYDPPSSSWKTSQLSLAGEAETWSENLPRSGMTLAGRCYRLTMWERRTSAKGGGVWLTPSTEDGKKPSQVEIEEWSRLGSQARDMVKRLRVQANVPERWPTPRAEERGNYQRDRGEKGKERATLTGAVKLWPTPAVAQAEQGQNEPDGKRGQTLIGAARGQIWPTPKGSISGPDFARMERPESGGDDLATAVARLPTPTALDGAGFCGKPDKGRTGPNSGRTLTGKVLELEGLGPHAVKFPSPSARDHKSGKGRQPDNGHTPQLPEVIGGQLNPTWVEWLMGYPPGWTELGDLETQWFRNARGKRSRG